MKTETRTVTKHSIFCQNKATKGIVDVLVFFKNANQWIRCRGKIYVDGRCRYWHNGKEAVVGAYTYQNVDGFTEEQKYQTAVNLNLQQLNCLYPKRTRIPDRNFNIHELLERYSVVIQ